ncbi:NADPH:quinone reductase [Lentzea waywayandensis]|uniref:NADPH:quinone reductase n=1 Tax=Lentzea waywayandensis TaxID=84724 RepID=A0A1I6FJ20_9PSEU|nr:NADP-dependent oxidoreductase [Lentzea waywayandensis]SFR29941.1 NADPH:quinone reductase [Lentzea waywayandensis]
MRAIVYRRYGDADVLEVAELPEPKMQMDSVLVRVVAAGLNPADAAYRSGAVAHTVDAYFPVIPGWDVAGVVEQAGPGAPEFAPGDEVIGYIRGESLRQHGGYAELVSADVRTLVRKPINQTWAQAAGLPLAGLTAYRAVTRSLAISAGETLLVHGAAGGVGSLAVQIAVAAGARVIGTASPGNHEYLRSLGAEPVGYGNGLAGRVRALAPGGVDAVLDVVGGDTLADTAEVGTPFVRVATVAGSTFPGAIQVSARLDTADFTALVHLVEAGRVSVRVAATYPLEKAAEAQQALADGHSPGKIVLEVSQPPHH